MIQEFTVLHLFAGIGGGALGFSQAVDEWRGMVGKFRNLAGIDVDPEVCADFEALTGAPAAQIDLFSKRDYKAFHGQEPPEDWHEATGADIYDATGGEYPDVVFLSPPCKGFSGLLPKASAKSEKYQALNRLVTRGLELTLDAFELDKPGLILIENVPRITSRGKGLLKQVKQLLGRHGYVFHEGFHDCGEIGGLAQRRKRYLLIARHEAKLPNFVYKPPIRELRTIGDVIGPMPMPDDPAAGPMHNLPRLQWKTWVRLALIPAGGDWRDLQDIEAGQYLIQPHMGENTFGSKYHVLDYGEPAGTVTGSRLGSGAPSVADPRGAEWRNGWKLSGAVGRVSEWDSQTDVVLGHSGPRGNGASNIADPRFPASENRHTSHYRVVPYDGPAGTVTGATHIANGAPVVADPRLDHSPRSGVYQVNPWDEPSGAIVGAARVGGSNGVAAVADPRLDCKPRSGTMGVNAWDSAAPTVIGSADVHSGSSAVADPRIPAETEQGTWVIIAPDGTWHRPLTTLELAALQGFDTVMPDGSPLVLTGRSNAKWRERIGNAVPPPAARAIATQMLMSLMPSAVGKMVLGSTGIWVKPQEAETVRQEVQL